MSKRDQIIEIVRIHTTGSRWTPEGLVDAVLDSLMEPSGKMVAEGRVVLLEGERKTTEAFRAMLRAAR